MGDRSDHRATGESALARLIGLRLARRDVLKAGVALGAAALGARRLPAFAGLPGPASTLTFTEIAHGRDETHHVPPGYEAQVLLRWGDPLFPDAPPFVPGKPDAHAQERQFGCDNDFIAFMPLPKGSSSATRGLLCVNHERCTTRLMWPGMGDGDIAARMTAEQCAHEMAAQGFSVVKVRFEGEWRVILESRFNRRISARTPGIRVSGPAAGSPRMKTRADPDGTSVVGTFNNCAGGVTPWGTVLTCEENFHFYFLGDPSAHPESAALERYGVTGRSPYYFWGRHFERFHLQRTPNEPNRFGWVVEIDPYDPQSVPVKRTALGRFKHEGAASAVSHDGRVAIYMGDDERFEYLYKFVTEGRVRGGAAPPDILDPGTLYVARFEADGRMRWLPLVYGQGPLTPANGFRSQADVVIEARRAADLVGATTLDRPEDVEASPVTGHVYVVLTNNSRRTAARVNPASPRAPNPFGHILEIVPPRTDRGVDHTATECRWEFFLLAGNPEDAKHSAHYAGPVSSNGWLACPDNVAFDPRGRIWIATDGQDQLGFSDSLYAADTRGPGRGITRLFFNAPRGAEVCGPCFPQNGNTLFLAVQHPGAERGSTFEKPTTRWPDFRSGVPPRPAVLAITKKGGGEIGS